MGPKKGGIGGMGGKVEGVPATACGNGGGRGKRNGFPTAGAAVLGPVDVAAVAPPPVAPLCERPGVGCGAADAEGGR